ncbi:hypothetical protein ACLQ2R_27190 [Streptosporangium sp. DT93]|uniref:hypothetical protein n=1 Tax=Streptosporangium sp. DT93 TaxID=3393428 RepID=UPI003CF59E6A
MSEFAAGSRARVADVEGVGGEPEPMRHTGGDHAAGASSRGPETSPRVAERHGADARYAGRGSGGGAV